MMNGKMTGKTTAAGRVALAVGLAGWLALVGLGGGVGAAPCGPDPPPGPAPIEGPAPIIEPAPGQLPGLPGTGGGGCAGDPLCDGPGGGRPGRVGLGALAWLAGQLGGPGVARAAGAPCDPAPAPAPEPPPPPPPVDPCPDRQRCAVDVASAIRLPDAQLRINPGTVGLVNLPSFFWVEVGGWRGEDLVASRTWSGPAGGGADYIPTTVEVRYRWQGVIYNFGDGGEIERRTMGTPYRSGDTSSEIQNAYGWSSLTEPGGVFHPGLAIVWSVDYTINGEAGRLSDVVRRYDVPGYPVQQSQPIIVAPGR